MFLFLEYLLYKRIKKKHMIEVRWSYARHGECNFCKKQYERML